MISQGDVCWAELPDPLGSGPGFRRPVVVVQGDAFNRSTIATAVCVLLTSNLRRAKDPGNLSLKSSTTGLTADSVANVSQIYTIGRSELAERIGRLSPGQLAQLLRGIDLVLGR